MADTTKLVDGRKVKVYSTKGYEGKLEPVDKTRCQFEKNEYHPFIMGGSCHQTIRCENTPTVVAKEKGAKGAMSLCDEHKALLEKARPGFCTFTTIRRSRRAKRPKQTVMRA